MRTVTDEQVPAIMAAFGRIAAEGNRNQAAILVCSLSGRRGPLVPVLVRVIGPSFACEGVDDDEDDCQATCSLHSAGMSTGRRNIMLGTAGHVDHGKSALW